MQTSNQSDEEFTKTSLRLRADLHEALRLAAEREQRTFTVVLHRWLEKGRAAELAEAHAA